MSDANLLVFGCAVSFIAIAGAYLYLRESFMSHEQPARATARRATRRED